MTSFVTSDKLYYSLATRQLALLQLGLKATSFITAGHKRQALLELALLQLYYSLATRQLALLQLAMTQQALLQLVVKRQALAIYKCLFPLAMVIRARWPQVPCE